MHQTYLTSACTVPDTYLRHILNRQRLCATALRARKVVSGDVALRLTAISVGPAQFFQLSCGLAAMDNMRKAAGRMPSGNAVGGLARVLLLGGAAVYGVSNSLFNVEGGHRAIVFNRLTGIKDEVRPRRLVARRCGHTTEKAAPFIDTMARPDSAACRCMRRARTS